MGEVETVQGTQNERADLFRRGWQETRCWTAEKVRSSEGTTYSFGSSESSAYQNVERSASGERRIARGDGSEPFHACVWSGSSE